jgi:phenylalanyl-tRNA synthetase alpha chain
LHLVTQTIAEITDIFKRIGFARLRYPEVETDYYAFGALNFPQGHPARDEWETFFIDDEAKGLDRRLLTPHATSGQVRELQKGVLPVRMINISKTYRRQSDASHTQMFHQFDGVYVDENVSIQHLKGVMDYFVKSFFGSNREIRLRPYDFNFTEPSFEIDINCAICLGESCKVCKEGWVELGGSGMIHPNVLKEAKIDEKKYNGFAFGWGVERVALMREGIAIPDLREMYRNDLRFLQQF